MTAQRPVDDEQELSRWISEVSEDWRMPPLRPGQQGWDERIERRRLSWPAGPRSIVRAVGTLAAGVVVVGVIGALVLSGLPAARTSDPGRGSDTSVDATVPAGENRDGLFSLRIEAGRARYAPNEPITILTTLRYIGDPERTTVTSSGAGLVAFRIEQLDGPIDAGPARDEDCVRFEYGRGDVEPVAFEKSGGYSNSDPNADFWRAFFQEPKLRLPAGEYRITAEASYGDPDCGGWRTLDASVLVVVE